MGRAQSDAIRRWQEEAGIEPVTGTRAEILGEMVQEATALITIAALEGSGIRDGDGRWYGCFPLTEIVFNLEQLMAEYEGRNPEGAAARARRKTARYGLELPPIGSEDCRAAPEPAR